MEEIARLKIDSLNHLLNSEQNKKQLVNVSQDQQRSTTVPIFVCSHPESKDNAELRGNIECIVIVAKNHGLSQPISITHESIPSDVWLEIQKALFNFSNDKNVLSSKTGDTLGDSNRAMDVLTFREKEILELLCDGLLYKEIAEVLGISALTVKNHLRNIYPKLKVANRSEAIVKYLGYYSVTCHCRQKFRSESM